MRWYAGAIGDKKIEEEKRKKKINKNNNTKVVVAFKMSVFQYIALRSSFRVFLRLLRFIIYTRFYYHVVNINSRYLKMEHIHLKP